MASKHPLLSKAIAAEHILDVVVLGNAPIDPALIKVSEEQRKDFGATFDVLDADKCGSLSLQVMTDLFVSLGADITSEQVGGIKVKFC